MQVHKVLKGFHFHTVQASNSLLFFEPRLTQLHFETPEAPKSTGFISCWRLPPAGHLLWCRLAELFPELQLQLTPHIEPLPVSKMALELNTMDTWSSLNFILLHRDVEYVLPSKLTTLKSSLVSAWFVFCNSHSDCLTLRSPQCPRSCSGQVKLWSETNEKFPSTLPDSGCVKLYSCYLLVSWVPACLWMCIQEFSLIQVVA